MSTIKTAFNEYARRPADERFPDLASLVTAAQHDKNLSRERNYPIDTLSVRPADNGQTVELVNGQGQSGRFTHWSFGQLARLVGAPAGYLRDDLSPALAADCLNYGLRKAGNAPAQILVRAANGKPQPTIRAITTQAYSRLWDCDLYRPVLDQLQRQDARWQLPPTWSGEPAGAYRGDRDSFLILTNGGSIVTDPSLMRGDSSDDGARAMYRGLLIRNSEVGAASIVIEQILFRYICGNHMLWGAVIDRSFRRRHVGRDLSRDTMREIGRIAYAWANHSAERDQAIVRGLIATEIAPDRDKVIAQLRAWGATEDQATGAYDACEQAEAVSPRSFWGIGQGLTRVSQTSGYQDARYVIDRLAGQILARGAARVAA